MDKTPRIKSLCKLYLGPQWSDIERISVEQFNKGCSSDILTASVTDDDGKILDKVGQTVTFTVDYCD